MHGGVPAIAPNIFLRSIKSAPNDDETITLMTLEGLNTFLQLASAVILALTFLVGAGAIWTSYRLGKRQSARIAAIELEAAQQRERAAVAERDLLQLRQRLAPRSLTLSQRQALLVALQSAPSKGPVEVSSPTGNGEARDFARELIQVLKEAGWPLAGEEIFAELVTGVGLHVVVRDLAAPPTSARALRAALSDAGLESDLWSEPENIPLGTVRLAVTTKPQ